MKFFVTGVGGQLGHDVMNELLKRGHEGVCSDIQENYSGVKDGSAVTKAPYVALDITNKDAVEKVITEVNPDAVITVQHGLLWIWQRMTIKWRKSVLSTQVAHRILQMSARSWTVR